MGDRRRTANGKQNLPRAHDYVIGSFHIRMSARALTWVGSPTDCLLERLLWVIVPRMLGCASIYQRDMKPPGVRPCAASPRGNEIAYLRGQIVADPGLFLISLSISNQGTGATWAAIYIHINEGCANGDALTRSFTMSTGPLILAALARVRCREALPARISLAAYLHLIVRPRNYAPLSTALKMHVRHLLARSPSPHFHKLAKTLKELLCGRRKALLIGIQNPTETEEVVEECAPASVTAVESAAGPSPIASMPRAPRKRRAE